MNNSKKMTTLAIKALEDKKGNDTRPVYSKWLQGKSKRMYVIAMPEQEKPEDD